MNINNKIGFTFVELIVTITIVVILSSVGFVSYSGYIGDARDSQRKSDLSQIASALKVYKQKRGYYGFPGDLFYITYSGAVVAQQGRLNANLHLDSLEKLPFDPKNKESYFYSITNDKQEFEVSCTLENQKNNISLLKGSYKSVSKNILPTITLAISAPVGSSVEIQDGNGDGTENRKLFVYDNQNHNLPYIFTEPYEPYTDGIGFDELIDEVEGNGDFWQNTDYRNCTEIDEAGKAIVPFSATSVQYQIITETGALVNTGCTL